VGQPDLGFVAANWNLFSAKAAKKGVGAFKDTIWTRKGLIDGKRPAGLKEKFGGLLKPKDGTIMKLTEEDLIKIIGKPKQK
jgi:hypothetical protein